MLDPVLCPTTSTTTLSRPSKQSSRHGCHEGLDGSDDPLPRPRSSARHPSHMGQHDMPPPAGPSFAEFRGRLASVQQAGLLWGRDSLGRQLPFPGIRHTSAARLWLKEGRIYQVADRHGGSAVWIAMDHIHRASAHDDPRPSSDFCGRCRGYHAGRPADSLSQPSQHQPTRPGSSPLLRNFRSYVLWGLWRLSATGLARQLLQGLQTLLPGLGSFCSDTPWLWQSMAVV